MLVHCLMTVISLLRYSLGKREKMDLVKEHLVPKSFHIVTYASCVIHTIVNVMISVSTGGVSSAEERKFDCNVNKNVDKSYIKSLCLENYNDMFNSPLPLFGFVLVSLVLHAAVSIVYSLYVKSRVEEIEHSLQEDGDTERDESIHKSPDRHHPKKVLTVFNSYVLYLIIRFILGVILNVLQYVELFRLEFPSKFTCDLRSEEVLNSSTTSSVCNNSAASGKTFCAVFLFIANVAFAVLALSEFLFVLFKTYWLQETRSFVNDREFVCKHFLRKRHQVQQSWRSIDSARDSDAIDPSPSLSNHAPSEGELLIEVSHNQSCALDNVRSEPVATDLNSSLSNDACNKGKLCHEVSENQSPIHFEPAMKLCDIIKQYKNQIFRQVLPLDIYYGQSSLNPSINDIFVQLIIHTGRARQKDLKEFGRPEIDDVYYELPYNSIPLHQVEDFFKPNKDTGHKFPRTILVVGRPGIGKTVLCQKIRNDWANNESDMSYFYNRKVIFLFKFRWFNIEDRKFSLKSLLLSGIQTEITSEQFDVVFRYIWKFSENAVFIFDGLDESNADFEHIISKVDGNFGDDENSPAVLFVKLVKGHLLPRATILVTTRATADHIYSMLRFQRQVEVLGFTRDKIKEYVERFCRNHALVEKKDMIMGYIRSNVQIHKLCYIPVNCFIVCFTLLGCLLYPNSHDSPLPTTLTELYKAAVLHLQRHHEQNRKKPSTQVNFHNLQNLAFYGVEKKLLIFDSSAVENNMEESSLLHRLSNPIFPGKFQYCFVHLTMQEFLAAQYVVEVKTADEICKFVESNLEKEKWRLVLQFIAGLLGEKLKLTDEYNCCVDVFASSLQYLGSDGVNDRELDVLKCVNEFRNESVMKEAASKCFTEEFEVDGTLLLIGDWSALTTFLKLAANMRSLTIRRLRNDEGLVEIAKMVRDRCFVSLIFSDSYLGDSSLLEFFDGLTTSSCKLKHQHCQLKKLEIVLCRISDSGMMRVYEFLKSDSGRNLAELTIRGNEITSKKVSTLCETLSSHEVGNHLSFLDLSGNPLGNKGVAMLCDVYREKQLKITDVRLECCDLTSGCVSSLCELFNEKYFECRELHLGHNQLGDEAVTVFHVNLIKKQTQLKVLALSACGLTSECMPLLFSLLNEKFINLEEMFLEYNEIGDNGADLLFRSLAKKHFKLKKLNLVSSRLTNECMLALCELVKDEHCNLEHINMRRNNITDKYIPELCNALRRRHSKRAFSVLVEEKSIFLKGKV